MYTQNFSIWSECKASGISAFTGTHSLFLP